MNPPYRYPGQSDDPAYNQSCTICNTGSKLGCIKYHTYSTTYSPQEQLQHTRTMFCHIIILLLKGEIRITWGKERDVLIRAGEMFFLPRGAEISGCIDDDVSYVEVQIDRHMSNKEIDDLRKMREYEDFDRYKFGTLPMRPPMQRFAESLEEYLLSGVNCSHLMESKLTELLVIFHWYYSLKENALFFYPMAESISGFREFIISNYKISNTIEELVERANMSRSTFDRKFKETFGTTPHKWIEKQILHAIIHKASEPNVTVKDLMCEVEIYNQSQFTHLCKRLCGLPPSKVIRLHSCSIKM